LPEAPYELPEIACVFGLKIEELSLPGEDPAWLRAELNRWYAFYRARSPIAVACIGWAFHAWLRLRRARSSEDASQKLAIHRAEYEWDDAQFDVVEKYKGLLAPAPTEAVRGLEGFAAGCRWLINRWQRHKGSLEKDGTWSPRDRDEVIRLLGAEPDVDRLRDSRGGYLTWLYWTLTQPDPDEAEIAALEESERMPPALRGQIDFTRLPTPAGCREWLNKLIDQVLVSLRQREEALWVKVEEPGRSQAIARELESIEDTLRKVAVYRRYSEESLKRNLKMAAAESKRAGFTVPRGAVPYNDE
jgi:hypothetical protein